MQQRIASSTSPSATTATTPIEHDNSTTAFDVSDHLPLQFVKSEIIPPAPTHSESTIDWLPDFVGYSWIAYGASSLVVISHLPSPLSEEEVQIGPIFRQVMELFVDGSAAVSAVSWSPVTPSVGDLAVACDECIGLFSYDSETSNSSFCWSQSAVLVQSTKVDAIKWTDSGDGMISGGVDVVLWRKKGRSWEMAWKLRAELPQSLLSATWSIEGLSATAPQHRLQNVASSSLITEASKYVIVCHTDGKSEHVKVELHHPLPVCMIQWRPSARSAVKKDGRHSMRHVLLTCCLDGTVRLWSEITEGRGRKSGYDINDQKSMRLSFCVAAVIEINQTLNGTLGSNTYVTWATEIDSIGGAGLEDDQYYFPEGYQHDKAARCEWLIGIGPQMMVTFWAVHNLDDMAPMRFPRVTLWKRQELVGSEVGTNDLVLGKVVISRNQVFGPPTTCSLIQFLPCNSLSLSQLYTQPLDKKEDTYLSNSSRDNLLSCRANGVLEIDGHTGKILQIALHPCRWEVELAASLDSAGSLLFWSLPTSLTSVGGLPTLNPSWKLSGKLVFNDSYCKYTSLLWAPFVPGEVSVLLMGHIGGIDCFMVKVSKSKEESYSCRNICTIPFTAHDHGEGPTKIFSIPLPSTCKLTSMCNSFMLLAVWKHSFEALSWVITMHSYDVSGGCCGCNFDGKITAANEWTSESSFYGKRYCVTVHPCSSVLPDPHNHDQVTSFAVLCPINFFLFEGQKGDSVHKTCSYSAYHMVTGCSNGNIKLWRSLLANPSDSNFQWELVGMLAAEEGPIRAISLSDCGRKIATTCQMGNSNTSTIRIWESVKLTGGGSFILEDTLSLDGDIVSLNWFTSGNAQLLLGVCLQNEFQVYALRHKHETLMQPGKPYRRNIWSCIACAHTNPAIRDFIWGPGATVVVVHDECFGLFSQFLSLADKRHQANCHSKLSEDNSPGYDCVSDKLVFGAKFPDSYFCHSKETVTNDFHEQFEAKLLTQTNVKKSILPCIFPAGFQQKYNPKVTCFWSVSDLVETLDGALPEYHPEALLMNISSGYWKRALVALQHLVEYLTSSASTKGDYSIKSSHFVSPVPLSNYLEGVTAKSSSDKTFLWSEQASSVASSFILQEGLTEFMYGLESTACKKASSTKSELRNFVETLEKLYHFPAVSSAEKLQFLAVVDLLCEIIEQQSASAYESLDEPGRRFWVRIRFEQLYFARRFGRLAAVGELVVDSGLVAWAFHSDCQENLLNNLFPIEPSWQEMRNLGFGFWFTNATQLRMKMEKLARQQYLKSKDPKACALLYIALNRLQVLAGLFKISKDEKDKPLVGFLSRNFQEDKNKAAALKNAYVLMGRHQLELAIAFFLLGGDTSSAIMVCVKNLGDEQLALVICRLVEGYGGSLERHLISKFLLPSAIEKGDDWLASYLEWTLGNYLQSFQSMIGVQMDSLISKSAISSNHDSFLDPSIGQYCLMLANKTSMKNAVGEQNATILGRWAILMSATALNRWGLPLEALECYSSSLGSSGNSEQGNVPDTASEGLLNNILKTTPHNITNWASVDVSSHMESLAKVDLAMQYISKLLREHPSWPGDNMISIGDCAFSENEIPQYNNLLDNFQNKLTTGLAYFEQKFSLIPLHLINKIISSLCYNGSLFIGYHVLQAYISKDLSHESKTFDSISLYQLLPKLLLKTTEELSCLLSRYIVASNITCTLLKSPAETNMAGEKGSGRMVAWGFCRHGIISSLRSLGTTLKLLFNSRGDDCLRVLLIFLDLLEFYIYFASAWIQRNFKVLISIVKPLVAITSTSGHAPYEIDMADLEKLLHQITELLRSNSLVDDFAGPAEVCNLPQLNGDIRSSIPEDDRWQIIGASLWGHVSGFLKHCTNLLSEKLEASYSFDPLCSLSTVSDLASSEHQVNCIQRLIPLVSAVLSRLMRTTCVHVSSYRAKQLALLLHRNVEEGFNTPTILWLEEFSQPKSGLHKHLSQGMNSLDVMNKANQESPVEILWNISTDPNIILGPFARDSFKLLEFIKLKSFQEWSDTYTYIMREGEDGETCNHESRPGSISASSRAGLPVEHLSPSDHSFPSSGQKDTIVKKEVPFHNPKEIYKRNGELWEALCISSIDQQHAALAGHRKGIIFFNWETGLPSTDQSDYIWTETDWPQWAASESNTGRTCTLPGVGLESKKGGHLGLGGETVGNGSLARPGRDLTGGGAFGVPGYAGIGASGLGWGLEGDLEEFVDSTATAESISTRAFSSHPSRSFFLVGSGNSHVYLWEFGKERALATYGVHPAANVRPPYSLASLSAVQFDHCGHRFATAALDGAICTWQLEVGGRSYLRPTESSLCFNGYASDVKYVTSSGSIIAASGDNSNGANVVIWDTLAPASTSQASIACHKGGARSLSVFDNDIGSGSISPLIVTGGKGGDVGLHDFRYIATGRTNRHRHSSNSKQNNIASSTDNSHNIIGERNTKGMLWYIPKAHLGSVTKICTIPHTSFFLTGSKDGDVKLWDAKGAKLVHHWSKLHDRHTFLQPSTRGFGGIVRAAVTDIQVVSHGFLTCGGDGCVKFVQLKDPFYRECH